MMGLRALQNDNSDVSILHKKLDPWMIGGLSIIFLIFFHFFVSPSADTVRLSWVMYYISFFINWPHFIASYQMLYQDCKAHFSKPHYFWAGVVVPVILLLSLGYSIVSVDSHVLSWIVQLMFVTVGWHYVKQVFGMIVVPSALNGVFLNRLERVVILINLYSLWALSFCYGQSHERQADFYGVKYYLIGVPNSVMDTLLGIVILTGLIVVLTLVKKYIREAKSIHPYGILAYLGLYMWYLPAFHHAHFFYMIPFFHSLQYLLFVFAVKKNEYSDGQDLSSACGREVFVKRFGRFFGTSFILGMICFLWLPKWLDSQMSLAMNEQASALGGSVFMASFHLFINIHHYFIDNVIWTKESRNLRILLAKRA